MQFLCNFAGTVKHNFSNDDFWFEFNGLWVETVCLLWLVWLNEGWNDEEEELEDHLWKLSSERRELYVLSADMVPRGILLVFFSSSSLLPPSSALTRVVVRPCFSSLSISTPRLNREKSFTLSIPKVLWESSNLEPINRKKQSGILNPDLLDPGEYVMEKVDT